MQNDIIAWHHICIAVGWFYHFIVFLFHQSWNSVLEYISVIAFCFDVNKFTKNAIYLKLNKSPFIIDLKV